MSYVEQRRQLARIILKREFTEKQRKGAARTGEAMPDGCLSGETLVTTREGPRQIKDLVGRAVLLDGLGQWQDVEINCYGAKALRKVVFDHGVVYATAGHRWPTIEGIVLTDELVSGDIVGTVLPNPVQYKDAKIKARSTEAGTDASSLYQMSPEFNDGSLPETNGLSESLAARLSEMYGHSSESVRRQEFRKNEASSQQWSISAQVRIDAKASSIPQELSEKLLCLVSEDGDKEGGERASRRSRSRNWQGSRDAVRIVQSHSRVSGKLSRCDGETSQVPYWTVLSVESTDRVEEVYCAVVPGTHTFVLDGGLVTGNSFPIGNVEDLHNALALLSHADDVSAAKEHIIRRATAIGAEGELPKKWAKKPAKVKKDDEEVGDGEGDEAGEVTKLDEENEPGDTEPADVEKLEKAIVNLAKSWEQVQKKAKHEWTHFGPDGKTRVPMKDEHKAKFEANKFVKKDEIVDAFVRISKDWAKYDAERATNGGKGKGIDAHTGTIVTHMIAEHAMGVAGQTPNTPESQAKIKQFVAHANKQFRTNPDFHNKIARSTGNGGRDFLHAQAVKFFGGKAKGVGVTPVPE